MANVNIYSVTLFLLSLCKHTNTHTRMHTHRACCLCAGCMNDLSNLAWHQRSWQFQSVMSAGALSLSLHIHHTADSHIQCVTEVCVCVWERACGLTTVAGAMGNLRRWRRKQFHKHIKTLLSKGKRREEKQVDRRRKRWTETDTQADSQREAECLCTLRKYICPIAPLNS